MNLTKSHNISAFSKLLRFWRKKQKFSQMELAALAQSTARHLSFLETGRSRPGRPLILKLAKALNMPVRDVNELLVSAGFTPEYDELDFTGDALKTYRAAIEILLENHEPYPACVMDDLGKVILANKAFMAFSPEALALSPEQAIDQFFNPKGEMRNFVINWADVAWSWVDRIQSETAKSPKPKLEKLLTRALAHLKGIERPQNNQHNHVISPQFKVGDQIISTFATMLRFESVSEVTLSEIRVELVFPADEPSRLFFENLSK